MAATSLIPIKDYLDNTSLHPDVEYIDGELKERNAFVSAHGLTQSLISGWFFAHEDE